VLQLKRVYIGSSAAAHYSSGNSLINNGPEASIIIANLLRIVACVRHLLLQIETLAPLGIIHQAYRCDIHARLFSKMYVHARCFVQFYRALM